MQGRAHMRIVVVRHGQAQSKKGWTGPDDLRPLTERGVRQAERLGEVITARPDRILSSPAVRCRDTVQPLAVTHGLEVELAESLSTGGGDDATDLCLKLADSEPAGSVIVLCSHRETMTTLLPALVGDSGPDLRHRLPGAKGGAWILGFRSGRVESVDYRPPAA